MRAPLCDVHQLMRVPALPSRLLMLASWPQDERWWSVERGYRWVREEIRVEGSHVHQCSSQLKCRFTIAVNSTGDHPLLGHFFRVRMVGPAIVMGSVREVGGGVYEVDYVAPDPGVYQMSVSLRLPLPCNAQARECGPAMCNRETESE